MAESVNNVNKYLDYNGLSTLWGRIDSLFVRKADIADEREKLAGIAEGAQVNVIENVAIVAEGATSATANDMVSIVGKTAVIRVENSIPATYNEKTPIRPASTKAVKDYVDQKIADKNVGASGDDYVSATASANKVTVAATDTLKSAVTAANSALQTVTGSSYITVSTKASNSQTITAKTGGVSAGADGLALASDVKDYVDDAVANKNVGATSTADYIGASASNNTVTVSATMQGVATASASKKGLAEASDVKSYVDTTVANKNVGATSTADYIGASASNNTVTVSATMQSVTASSATKKGLAEASDVKSYVDAQINDVKNLVTASTQFLGVSTTEIKDGAATPTTVNNKAVGAGDIALYGTSEFIWDGAKWVLLGDTTAEAAAISDLEDRMQDVEDDLATYKPKVDNLVNGTTTVKSFGGQMGEITVDNDNNTAGEVKFSMNGKELTGAVNGWSDVSSKASSALQSVAGSTYIEATTKSGNSQTINAKIQSVTASSATKKGLAEASDVKSYVDAQVGDVNALVNGLTSTSTTSTADITRVVTETTQTNGVVTVTYTEFRALTTAEIENICK